MRPGEDGQDQRASGFRQRTSTNRAKSVSAEMISALRHYEANQKALQAQDETLGKAVNDVARM